MRVVPFQPEHLPAIRSLNEAFRRANVDFQFPDGERDEEWPRLPGKPVYRERFVACDKHGVHGGYLLKEQAFSIAGEKETIAQYALPLSRGIIDPEYRAVGKAILNDVLKRHPRLYVLGMGGLDRRLPRQLAREGFRLELIPFYFRVLDSERFLEELRYGRNRRGVRLAFALARLGGLPRLHRWTETALEMFFASSEVEAELVPRFGRWADEIWREASAHCGFLGYRDARHLNTLFWDSTRYRRLKVSRAGRAVGWALLVDTHMKDNAYFGDMHVGTIVDSLARPGEEATVARAATRFLAEQGAELAVSNQSQQSWRSALLRSGFLRGPSNYVLAISPALQPDFPDLGNCHVTRGDGSGPINL